MVYSYLLYFWRAFGYYSLETDLPTAGRCCIFKGGLPVPACRLPLTAACLPSGRSGKLSARQGTCLPTCLADRQVGRDRLKADRSETQYQWAHYISFDALYLQSKIRGDKVGNQSDWCDGYWHTLDRRQLGNYQLCPSIHSIV